MTRTRVLEFQIFADMTAETNGSLAQRVREVVAHNRSKAGGPNA